MARSRYIKPDFFDDPVLARCSHGARLLFVACWQVADRSGVFEWDLPKLRKYAFGYENVSTEDVERMLGELLGGRHIQRANHDGREYGRVPNLAKHQKFHVKEVVRFDVPASLWGSSPVPAPTQHPPSTLPAALCIENGVLRIENGEPQVAPAPALENDGPIKREIRSTRGFPESAFEAEFVERGKAGGVTVSAFGGLEKSIAGKLLLRCGPEGITQAQLLAEWWRPEWREHHGFDVRALERNFAKVRAAIADPKLRPRSISTAPEPRVARPPSADETARKLAAEQAEIENMPRVDDEEASRRFAEMRRKAGL